jgi:TRAP-type C4-dicarboxylate transport system substrate-binding protein
MKKITTIIILLGLCGLLVLPATVGAATIKLRMASQNPETSWGHTSAVAPWAEQVNKATNGQVEVQVYAGQTLCKGNDTWEATKAGIADIGWCFHGYWPGLTPLADVVSLPALPFKTAEEGSELFWKLYEKFPAIQQEFADVKVLCLYTSDPYLLITRDKQVKTLEDLKGLKIRAAGGPPTDQIKALGGVPMLIPMPDNYLSLQKGVIDGMGAPWEAIQGFRLQELV